MCYQTFAYFCRIFRLFFSKDPCQAEWLKRRQLLSGALDGWRQCNAGTDDVRVGGDTENGGVMVIEWEFTGI
jgi:hypothetical protein